MRDEQSFRDVLNSTLKKFVKPQVENSPNEDGRIVDNQ